MTSTYSTIILDHFHNPRCTGELDKPDIVAESVNPACLDRLRLHLRIQAGIVAEARFQARGCVPAIGCASILTEHLHGRARNELAALDAAAIEGLAGGLPRNKKHAAALAAETLRLALEQWPHSSATLTPPPGT